MGSLISDILRVKLGATSNNWGKGGCCLGPVHNFWWKKIFLFLLPIDPESFIKTDINIITLFYLGAIKDRQSSWLFFVRTLNNYSGIIGKNPILEMIKYFSITGNYTNLNFNFFSTSPSLSGWLSEWGKGELRALTAPWICLLDQMRTTSSPVRFFQYGSGTYTGF